LKTKKIHEFFKKLTKRLFSQQTAEQTFSKRSQVFLFFRERETEQFFRPQYGKALVVRCEKNIKTSDKKFLS
jgi:hypothetical protein